jgi:hypothetical protein
LKFAAAGGVVGAAAILGAYEFLKSPLATTTTGSCGPANSSISYANSDYAFFIEPYQFEVSRLVGWLTTPWATNTGGYGYDPNYQLIRGGNWPGYSNSTEAYGSGYHPGMVLIDSNFLVGMSLDSFTKSTKNPTNVYNACRNYLNSTNFVDPASSASPSTETYKGTDRREILLGKYSPYYVKGKGPVNQVYLTASQIWYVPGHTLSGPDPIVTALPTSAVASSQDMEFFAPLILLEYMQGNIAQAKSDFLSVINSWQAGCPGQLGSPFGGNYASRDLSFTIIVARSCVDTNGTPFWLLPNVQPVVAEIVQSLWAIQGSDGSIPTSYNPSTGPTPESTGEALLAFDPNLPARFA